MIREEYLNILRKRNIKKNLEYEIFCSSENHSVSAFQTCRTQQEKGTLLCFEVQELWADPVLQLERKLNSDLIYKKNCYMRFVENLSFPLFQGQLTQPKFRLNSLEKLFHKIC